MNRKEKIRLLKMISAGKATADILQSGKVYFVEHDSKAGTYKVGNFKKGEGSVLMDKEQFEKFRERIEQLDSAYLPGQHTVLFWYEEKTY
jgi:hypothetical protein